eukprot:scaffold22260_cov63-Phaeocystis_antarctica.AAC.1
MSRGVHSREAAVEPVLAALGGSPLVCAAEPVPAAVAPPLSACSLSATDMTPEGTSGGCLLPETPSLVCAVVQTPVEDSCRAGAGLSAPSSGDEANGISASVAGFDGTSASFAIVFSLSVAMVAGVSAEPVVSNVPSSLMASPSLPPSSPRVCQYSGSPGEFSGSPGDFPASRTGTSLMSARKVESCII